MPYNLKDKSKFRDKLLSGQSDISVKETSNKFMVFSLKDIDRNQGQSFLDWHNCALLHIMLDKLHEFSKKTLPEAQRMNFTIYDNFPKESDFEHPDHIAPDAKWASMHIQGLECIAGHLVGNIFHIVFLDKDHRFWITHKKHT